MEAIEENEIDRYRFLGTISIDARLPGITSIVE